MTDYVVYIAPTVSQVLLLLLLVEPVLLKKNL